MKLGAQPRFSVLSVVDGASRYLGQRSGGGAAWRRARGGRRGRKRGDAATTGSKQREREQLPVCGVRACGLCALGRGDAVSACRLPGQAGLLACL